MYTEVLNWYAGLVYKRERKREKRYPSHKVQDQNTVTC